MMTLAVDGRMGASGDMLLGALVAAGADPSALDAVEDELAVRYEIRDVIQCGISATAVDVQLTADGTGRDSSDEPSPEDGHSHDHSHTDGDSHDHTDAEGAGPSRTYLEVVELVESMDLPGGVEQDALAMFELLGQAEANVHDTDLESTHFHEVGADDAIADIVGVCLLLDNLAVEQVVTTPVATGGGTVEMSHGSYPIPPPAVVELAEMADWSLSGGPVETELLTPTGAAILAHVAEGVDTLPTMDIQTVGYGSGSKSFESHPNVVRVLRGQSEGGLSREPITVLETHLDDVSPEVLGGLSETLTAVGALDVTILPTAMKKSRPGHLVKIVTKPSNAAQVARELARETGTLGVREHGSGHRFVAERTVESVVVDIDGEQFDVAVKIATFSSTSGSPEDGEVFDVSCEYDDAKAVANSTGLTTRDVLRRAERAAREQLHLGM